MAIEVPSPEDDNVLRHVSLAGGHRLLMWETGRTEGRGMMCRDLVGYAFWPAGQEAPLFLGEDFSPSPFHAIDGDDAIVALLGFLTLNPGDTDSEYFEKYSEEQLDWSRSDQCETLGFYLTIFDEDGEEDRDGDGDQFSLITDI